MTKHLDSLRVQNFRCFKDFTAEKLGDVNLIVGKNNSGKSTVLEAVYLYINKAPIFALKELATYKYEHDPKERHISFIKSFFTYNTEDYRISISGHLKETNKIESVFLEYGIRTTYKETTSDGTTITKDTFTKLENSNLPNENLSNSAFCIHYTNDLDEIGIRVVLLPPEEENWLLNVSENKASFKCSIVTSSRYYNIDSATELAFLWDNVKHNLNYKKEILNILKTIDSSILDFDFYGVRHDSPQRTIKIILDKYSEPVPLKSMGDGIVTIITYLIRAYNAKDGILLIDEVENGLHFSVQKQVWQVLFDLSQKLNMQIFATTHSWDAIEAFAQVAKENKDLEGVLMRMGRSARTSTKDNIIATIYHEDRLFDITQQEIEVR